MSNCTLSAAGHEYIGHKAETVSGRNCQSWSTQHPHGHSYYANHMFPDGSAVAAGNYCRNPDKTWIGLWCYTTDPHKRWEACAVPTCGKSTCRVA